MQPLSATAACMSTSTTHRPPYKRPVLTLVVNTFNAPEALDKVLGAIYLQSATPFEVLVADDGSGPATKAVIDGWIPRLGCVLGHVWQEHKGFRRTHVLNQAVLRAKGDYIVWFFSRICGRSLVILGGSALHYPPRLRRF